MRKELHRSLNLWPKPGMRVKSSWKPLPTFDPMSQPVKILLLRTLLLKAFRNHCLLPKHGLLPAKRSCKKQKPRWKLTRHCCRSCFALRFWKAHLVQIIEKINNYWKSIIIFFQSPISIIIEKFNIHLNNYWNRYWKILKNFAFQSELKKTILLIFSMRLKQINPWTLRVLVDTSAEFCWVRQNEAKAFAPDEPWKWQWVLRHLNTHRETAKNVSITLFQCIHLTMSYLLTLLLSFAEFVKMKRKSLTFKLGLDRRGSRS